MRWSTRSAGARARFLRAARSTLRAAVADRAARLNVAGARARARRRSAPRSAAAATAGRSTPVRAGSPRGSPGWCARRAGRGCPLSVRARLEQRPQRRQHLLDRAMAQRNDFKRLLRHGLSSGAHERPRRVPTGSGASDSFLSNQRAILRASTADYETSPLRLPRCCSPLRLGAGPTARLPIATGR